MFVVAVVVAFVTGDSVSLAAKGQYYQHPVRQLSSWSTTVDDCSVVWSHVVGVHVRRRDADEMVSSAPKNS
jgi:hypothetical protein